MFCNRECAFKFIYIQISLTHILVQNFLKRFGSLQVVNRDCMCFCFSKVLTNSQGSPMFNWPRRTAHSGHSICLYKILLIMLSLPSMANTDKTVFFIKEFIHQSIQHSLGQRLLYVLQFNARRSRVIYTRRRVNQYTGNITDHHTQSLHIHTTSIHTVAHTFILHGYTWCRSQEKCRSIMAIGLHETHVPMDIHNTYIPFHLWSSSSWVVYRRLPTNR